MKQTELKEITGKTVKEWYEWLRKEDQGCCSICFASTDKHRYCVCMGWHDYGEGPDEERGFSDGFRIAWKIGRQTHNNIMQCDLDVGFEMPYVTEAMAKADPELCEGDVDDTLEEVECVKIIAHKPFKYCGKTWYPWRWSNPKGYRDWNALAARMRKVARRVYRDWRHEDDQDERRDRPGAPQGVAPHGRFLLHRRARPGHGARGDGEASALSEAPRRPASARAGQMGVRGERMET